MQKNKLLKNTVRFWISLEYADMNSEALGEELQNFRSNVFIVHSS